MTSLRIVAERSTGWIPLSTPFCGLPMPTGVRTAETMTASLVLTGIPLARVTVDSDGEGPEWSQDILDLRRAPHDEDRHDAQQGKDATHLHRHAMPR